MCKTVGMKAKLFIIVWFFIGAACTYAVEAPAKPNQKKAPKIPVNMEALVKQNQKNALPKFPIADTKAFGALQKAAQSGDLAAQEKLPAMLVSHMKAVYLPLSKNRGLHFSVRDPVRGYDDATNNYAVNLDDFFNETTGQVKIKKHNFTVTATNGTVFQVRYPEYKPADASVKVMRDGQSMWIALADLKAEDKRFLKNIFVDEGFESAGSFMISSEDSNRETVGHSEKDKVSGTHEETGEKVDGSFISASTEGISRKIILENAGNFPLENLVVEYQSFTEQTIIKMPKDFPSEYCCAGFIEVKSLAPGEKKELTINLPETVTAKQTTIEAGDYEYGQFIPSNCNQKSDGRINGIWVKVHRFTPYGEKLTREYKSAGVPSVEWINVAPAGADIRR